MRYEPYNSPLRTLFKGILARGVVAISHYREGRGNSLNEDQVNRLGYWLLQRKRVKEAIEVFKLNVEDYPNSSNAYDSLGEAYMVDGDKERSIENYERSLKLDPKNQNAAEMLRKIKSQFPCF